MVMWIISDFFKAPIDNQLLHPVLKCLVGVLAEMHLDGVSCVPQLTLEAVGLLPVLGFCHIFYSFTKKQSA